MCATQRVYMTHKYPRSSVTEENKQRILEQRKLARALYKREYHKKYRESEHGSAVIKAARAKHRASELGKITKAKGRIKWKQKNRLKVLAHKSVYRALAAGKLIQPSACEGCSIQHQTLQAHHDDYSFPLKVRWLCSKCHIEWHKINGSGING